MKINFSLHTQSLADKFGDKEALVHVERDRRYSFREFHLLTNQIVNMMKEKLGLGLGDCYINILHNDNLSLLHFPTLYKGEATGVFTNLRDSLEERRWQMEYADAKVAFIENELLDSHYDMLRECGTTVVCMDPIETPREGLFYFWELLEGVSQENPNVVLDDREHITLIRFTGGTTGKGKPAAYSVENWLASKDSVYAFPDSDWGPHTRTVHIGPISHGSCLMLMPTLYAGGCNYMLNEPDLKLYAETIQREGITTSSLVVPTVLYRLLDMVEAESLDLSTLQNVFYGAAPMSPTKLKLLQEAFGNIFVQVYGSTEQVYLALSMSKAAHRIEPGDDDTRLSSAGQIVAGVELMIVDDDGNPVKKGEVGEIWMRSRGTCLGYYNNPEKTAEEFVDQFWKSGDMARMDEQGFVYIVDRKKDMIISGGFNVYATEVEAAVSAHPSVLMTAVVGIPHEEWGEAIHAEVVLKEGASLEEKELIAFVKELIGGYKAPKTVTFVTELPISPVGKVLRRAVRDKYWKDSDRKVG